MVDITRVLVGLFLFLLACTFFLINMFVMACIMKSRLYAKKDNSVYLLSAFNISTEMCQILLHILYISPSYIVGSFFFDGQDSAGVAVMSVIFLGLWYLGSLTQILFATNRFVVVCFPTLTFFTRERVVHLCILCCVLASVMVTYSQILSPCCRITPNPAVFGYNYLEVPGESFNPSMQYIDLPLDIGTSVYCGISYMVLFVYIVKAGSHNDRVGKREMMYCVQFLLMFLTYTVAWMTFFIYPALEVQAPQALVVTPCVCILNGGVNSIIYLLLNKEHCSRKQAVSSGTSSRNGHHRCFNSSISESFPRNGYEDKLEEISWLQRSATSSSRFSTCSLNRWRRSNRPLCSEQSARE